MLWRTGNYKYYMLYKYNIMLEINNKKLKNNNIKLEISNKMLLLTNIEKEAKK